jgi:coenzyme F420-reducing hydrogenase gamma subunit
MRDTRPTVAVIKFASCDGCQLSLLDCEDELLAVAERVHFAHFLEASRATQRGPYDLVLVEGSITTHDDARAIQAWRKQARALVTIGACATSGGIQALRNAADADAWKRSVYPSPQYVASLATSTAIAQHVPVDIELRGCPVDKGELLGLITAVLAGRSPRMRGHAVCLECKARGTPCVTVTQGTPCLGPVTHAGCGALCPSYQRGCFGCFGPMESPNTPSLTRWWREELEGEPADIRRAFHSYNAAAPAFRREGDVHD